jgi:hypothetical protein
MFRTMTSTVAAVVLGVAMTPMVALAIPLDTQSNPVPNGTITVAPGDNDRSDWDGIPSYPDDDPDTAGPEVNYQSVQIANDANNVYFHFLLNDSEFFDWRHHILIDVDQNRTTGYVGSGDFISTGTDYMLEGPSLYKFTGVGQEDWAWEFVEEFPYDDFPVTDIETFASLSSLGNPDAFDFVLYGASSLEEDFYPNGATAGLGGDYFTYEVGDVVANDLGDVNGDGDVNGLDVDPFVDVLLNGPYQVEADMNEDSEVNGLDVDPFVAAVVGGGVAAVPEPATWGLALLAAVALACWRVTVHGA